MAHHSAPLERAFDVSAQRPAGPSPARPLPGVLVVLALALGLLVPAPLARRATPQGYELPRRALLGASFAPSTTGEGLLIQSLVPGASFAAAGVEPGDLLTGLHGTPVSAYPDLIDAMDGLTAGDHTVVELRRGDDDLRLQMSLHPRPQEQGDGIVVEYGSVVAGNARLRTIVTRPRGEGPFPALMLLQGLSCFSVDAGNGQDLAYYMGITHELARRGILTLRVEKSGMGDSTGTPCSEIDFETEGRGYLAALDALVHRRDVERDDVFLFGHSMGGMFAPWAATRIPVKGIAAYGTGLRPWAESMLTNMRRQMLMEGSSPADTDEACKELTGLLEAFHEDRRPLPKILAEHPEWADFVQDPEHFAAGRHWTFFQQLGSLDASRLWAESGAHALAIYGSADFVSEGDDHAAIAALANDLEEGRGQLVVLEEMDHFFRGAADFDDSRQRMVEGNQLPFDPRIIDTLSDWIASLVTTPTGA